MPDHGARSLEGSTVLRLPLAVSDDLGDARTGLILSRETRTTASLEACREIANEHDERRVVCADDSAARELPELAEIELIFASDKPIPTRVLQALAANSRADYLLLFRPERVSSSQQVSHDKIPRKDPGMTFLDGPNVDMLIARERIVTSSSTEVAFTVSAALIDLRSGKLLRFGVHSGGGSRSEDRYMGFAEAPPAAPILAEIMRDLGNAVLED